MCTRLACSTSKADPSHFPSCPWCLPECWRPLWTHSCHLISIWLLSLRLPFITCQKCKAEDTPFSHRSLLLVLTFLIFWVVSNNSPSVWIYALPSGNLTKDPLEYLPTCKPSGWTRFSNRFLGSVRGGLWLRWLQIVCLQFNVVWISDKNVRFACLISCCGKFYGAVDHNSLAIQLYECLYWIRISQVKQ